MFLTNNTARVIYVGDAVAVPGIETEIGDEWENHPVLKSYAAKGEISFRKVKPAKGYAPATSPDPAKK